MARKQKASGNPRPEPQGNNDPCVRAFSLALRALREERDLSQETLAYDANLSRTFVGLLERRIHTPSLVTLCQLADALDISFADFATAIQSKMKKPRRKRCE